MSPIRIDPDEAAEIVELAAEVARRGHVPEEWEERTRSLGAAISKTYIAALGTALLAKATDERIDPMSIKATPSAARAYSARTLCHGVLVPASREYGFDLGATGREPLNNQPFFRYERIDQMERVRDQAGLRLLLAALKEVARLSGDEAEQAFAAFIKVRTEFADQKRRSTLRDVELGVRQVIDAAATYLNEEAEGGKRGQALVAGVLDLVFDEVRMGRINDPSRRFAGDVQAMGGVQVLLAVEVRQKVVADDDTLAFAEVAAASGVANAAVAALAPDQPQLDAAYLRERGEREHGVLLTVLQSADELIAGALLWSPQTTAEGLRALPQLVSDRLQEIEASARSVARWSALIGATT